MSVNSELCARITAYLTSGGLFNPEMAIHDRVRDLLIDCRTALSPKVPSNNHTDIQRASAGED